MGLLKQPRALIFDVDGTLAETEEAHRHAFNQAFEQAGLDWHWSQTLYRDLLKTTGGKERIRSYAQHRQFQPASGDLDEDIRRLHGLKTKFYTAAVRDGGIALRPGVSELLQQARRQGVRLGIATTTSEANVIALLCATLGPQALDWFDALCCGDSVANKKPAPDIYSLALRTMNEEPGNALAIEDSWNGLQSARAAGLDVLVTPSLYSSGEDFSGAAFVADSAYEITTLIFG